MPEPAYRVNSPAPGLPLMHAISLLAGFGTMLLGPILPLLIHRWQLTDAQAGLLLLFQFVGATVGGSTVSTRLQRGLLVGLVAAFVGFLLFALAPGLWVACACLLVGGFGVGRLIAANNILAGKRYTVHRASALSWLNFSWSLGALLSPLSAAWLASRFPLPYLLEMFAGLFLIAAGVLLLQVRMRAADGPEAVIAAATPAIGAPLFGYFIALLFVYGGFETCLSGWLTTYATRDPDSSLRLGQYIMVLLLVGLTAGRALAAWMLRHARDLTVQRLALVLAGGLTAALALTHQPAATAVLAVALGMALAPIFPATFALVLARGTPARQAGIVLAASGIGAAAFPWLMGVVSTQTGGLRMALAIPVAAAAGMLVLSFLPPRGASFPRVAGV